MYTRLCGIIKTNTLENPGCFCFSGKCGGESACVGAVLGKRGSGILTRLTGDARELPPAGAPRIFRGVFVFPGSAEDSLAWGCAGEKGLWHSDPAYRGRQRVASRRGSAARALPPFQNPCRRAAHHNYSLFILHSSLISSLPIPCYNRP